VQGHDVPPRVATEQAHPPGVRPQQPEQDADRRRLARPVGAQEAVYLAAADVHIDAVQGGELAEGLRQSFNFDHGR